MFASSQSHLLHIRAVLPFFPYHIRASRLKTSPRCILENVFVSVSTQGILNWSHSRLEWSSHAKLFPEQTYNVLGPFEVETQGAQSKPPRVSFEGTDMKSRAKLITPSHSKPCHRHRMKFKLEKIVKIMCYNMPWPGGHRP